MANITKMNKATLAEHGKSLGVKFDDNMTKKAMVDLIRQHNPVKTPAPKKKKSIVIGKPVMIPQLKTAAIAPKNKSIWQTIKEVFGV